MNEHFTCEACNTTCHTDALRHRITMPGDYCKTCADMEKCAACGEIYPLAMASFKNDVRNVICNDCENDYQDVKKYIKPIYSIKNIAA